MSLPAGSAQRPQLGRWVVALGSCTGNWSSARQLTPVLSLGCNQGGKVDTPASGDGGSAQAGGLRGVCRPTAGSFKVNSFRATVTSWEEVGTSQGVEPQACRGEGRRGHGELRTRRKPAPARSPEGVSGEPCRPPAGAGEQGTLRTQSIMCSSCQL